MSRLASVVVSVFVLLLPTMLSAQTDQGSLRGYVKDAQGGALPGRHRDRGES